MLQHKTAVLVRITQTESQERKRPAVPLTPNRCACNTSVDCRHPQVFWRPTNTERQQKPEYRTVKNCSRRGLCARSMPLVSEAAAAFRAPTLCSQSCRTPCGILMETYVAVTLAWIASWSMALLLTVMGHCNSQVIRQAQNHVLAPICEVNAIILAFHVEELCDAGF